MVISRLKNMITGASQASPQDNPAPAAETATETKTQDTSAPNNREKNAELLKKPDSVSRPEPKKIEEISRFTRIPKLSDIEGSAIRDKTGAQKILSRFSVDEGKTGAYSCKDGNHLAVFCGDKDVAVNNGLRSIFGSWFGLRKLFTGFDTRVALKFTAGDGVIDLVDKNETKIDKSQLAKGVKSGELKLVYIYQSGDGVEKTTEQKFDKEPLAIAVLHDYSNMLEGVEARLSAQFPDKNSPQRVQFQQAISKIKNNQSLKNIFSCDTILVNPKKKDQITSPKINSICKNVAECMPERTTLIFPREIAGNSTEAQSKNKRYSSIDWRHLETKDGKWNYVQKPITIVRDLNHGSDPIPEDFLTLNQMHHMSKVKDPRSIDPNTMSKIFEAQEFNKTSLADYDNSVKPGYNEEKAQEADKTTEKAK